MSLATVKKKKPFFKKGDIGLVYISPWLIGFLIFSIYPMVASLVYSFFDFDFMGRMRFVGFGNFVKMWKSVDFSLSTKATFIFVFFSVPAKLISAMLLAMLLNVKLRFINLYRTLYYLPSILTGSVAIGILWRLMFTKQGLINNLLGLLGFSQANWLGNPNTAIYVLIMLPLWQVGSSMVIFLAALKQIPGYLFEAARIDGAGKMRQFVNITLPAVSPIILFNLIMQSINTFQEFSSSFIITGGGPAKSTYLYAMFIYNEAFKMLKMGYASALSWFLFGVILVFTAVIFKTSAKWVFYGDGGDAL